MVTESLRKHSRQDRFLQWFLHQISGTKKLREQIEAGMTEKEIRKTWQEGLEQFKEIRGKIFDLWLMMEAGC